MRHKISIFSSVARCTQWDRSNWANHTWDRAARSLDGAQLQVRATTHRHHQVHATVACCQTIDTRPSLESLKLSSFSFELEWLRISQFSVSAVACGEKEQDLLSRVLQELRLLVWLDEGDWRTVWEQNWRLLQDPALSRDAERLCGCFYIQVKIYLGRIA